MTVTLETATAKVLGEWYAPGKVVLLPAICYMPDCKNVRWRTCDACGKSVCQTHTYGGDYEPYCPACYIDKLGHDLRREKERVVAAARKAGVMFADLATPDFLAEEIVKLAARNVVLERAVERAAQHLATIPSFCPAEGSEDWPPTGSRDDWCQQHSCTRCVRTWLQREEATT